MLLDRVGPHEGAGLRLQVVEQRSQGDELLPTLGRHVWAAVDLLLVDRRVQVCVESLDGVEVSVA